MRLDVLCIGGASIDMFLSLENLQGKARIDSLHEFCVRPGEKIEVQKTQLELGGNAANVAVGLSRLGFKTALVAEIGDDELSLKTTNVLAKEGVDRAFVKLKSNTPSALSVIINVDKDRTIFAQDVVQEHNFYYDYASPSYIYLTSLGDEWKKPYIQALEFAKDKNIKIVFNPGVRQLDEVGELIRKVLSQTEILIVNKEEAEALLGIKAKNVNIQELLVALKELGAKIVVVTDGKNGSYAIDEHGKEFRNTSHAEKIIERTGAGDAYSAGFLAALLHGSDVEEAMKWGSANSTSVISKIGSQAGLLTKIEMEKQVHTGNNGKSEDNPLLKHGSESLGYNKPLYILAFDHRNTFAKHLFNRDTLADLTEKERKTISEFKQIIFDGFVHAISHRIPKEESAILVDEELGTAVLEEAKVVGITTILTTEKSGQKEFELQYGQAFDKHIKKIDPTFAKVLLHYNPEDSIELKKRQQERLKDLSDWCHKNNYKFLLEVLVDPTQGQLAKVNSDQTRYDKELRPSLTVDVVKELQDVGIEPDIWKMEGLDKKADYEKVVGQIKNNGRDQVGLVVLGRGADEKTVEHWLKVGSEVNGVVGFAVGRTIFWGPLVAYYKSLATREEVVTAIGLEFQKLYEAFIGKPSEKEKPLNIAFAS